MQFEVGPGVGGARGRFAESPLHPREPGRHRALEGKDRLLLVADGEQRADRCARALAGEEFLGQRPITCHWRGLVSCASSTRI